MLPNAIAPIKVVLIRSISQSPPLSGEQLAGRNDDVNGGTALNYFIEKQIASLISLSSSTNVFQVKYCAQSRKVQNVCINFSKLSLPNRVGSVTLFSSFRDREHLKEAFYLGRPVDNLNEASTISSILLLLTNCSTRE